MSSTIATCVFFLLCYFPWTQGVAIQNINRSDRIPGEYLIKLNTEKWNLANDTLKQHKIDEIVNKISEVANDVEIKRKFVFRKIVILSIRCRIEASVASLDLPDIDGIEANVAVKSTATCEKQSSSPWALSRIARRDNPMFGGNTYEYMKNDGKGTYAYVFDTGIYTAHTYFQGRAEHGYTAFNVLEGDDDYNGHGTHCTGSILSSKFGVAKNAHAIAVKVLGGDGTGDVNGIIDGMEWAYKHFIDQSSNFKAVASMSLGAGHSPVLDAAVQELIDEGLPVVVAAGNDFSNACYTSPARVKDAITVGASESGDRLSDFSNWGSCVDIIAPGTDILSTFIGGLSRTKRLSGTSMAAPHVSGAVLRHLSQVSRRPSPKQVKQWLIASSTANRLNLRQTVGTPNKLLYAPCDVSKVISDPNTSSITCGNWLVVLLNTIIVCSVTLVH